MPSRNIIREYDTHAFYHLYNRGVEKRKIFLEPEDYVVFLAMLKRHLDSQATKDKKGRVYTQYVELELLAFCLMPNHFHLFVYQKENPQEFTQLLRSLCTAYTMYFNKKYKRVGYLFQDRFKAVRVTDNTYYQHISRYIHLNPVEPFEYEWSSLPYYLGERHASWIHPEKILGMFSGTESYRAFMHDYEGQKEALDKLKGQLANY